MNRLMYKTNKPEQKEDQLIVGKIRWNLLQSNSNKEQMIVGLPILFFNESQAVSYKEILCGLRGQC